MHELFDYSNINKAFSCDKESLYLNDARTNYKAFFQPNDLAFITIAHRLNEEGTTIGNIFKACGLKFHISLPEENRDLYAQGWNIIKDALIEAKVNCFKVAHSQVKMSQCGEGADLGKQRGKDVTIYAYGNPEKEVINWGQIFAIIAQSLADAGVYPGYATEKSLTYDRSDKPFRGNNYVSYRYEHGVPRLKAGNEYDPFSQIKFVIKNQQPNQAWTGEVDLPMLGLSSSSSSSALPSLSSPFN